MSAGFLLKEGRDKKTTISRRAFSRAVIDIAIDERGGPVLLCRAFELALSLTVAKSFLCL